MVRQTNLDLLKFRTHVAYAIQWISHGLGYGSNDDMIRSLCLKALAKNPNLYKAFSAGHDKRKPILHKPLQFHHKFLIHKPLVPTQGTDKVLTEGSPCWGSLHRQQYNDRKALAV